MTFSVLDDFSDGASGDIYTGKSEGNWSVAQFPRANSFGPARYQPTPFSGATPDGYVVDASTPIEEPPGGDGAALLFAGSSAWGLSATYEISDGLGGSFYSRGWTTDLGLRVVIEWSETATSRSGSLEVNRYYDELEIIERYADDDTSEENTSTVTLTDFLPSNPGDPASGLWLDIRFNRVDGWSVADPFGSTLASGAYSWSIPATGLEWTLTFTPNTFGPLAASGSVVLMVDQIFGWSGRTASAVRLYPRDDGLGMSSAPRRWPPPKGRSRVIGGYP